MTPDRLPERVVLANPDEDCSSAAFRQLLDEIESGHAPEIESLDAATVVRAIRGELPAHFTFTWARQRTRRGPARWP